MVLQYQVPDMSCEHCVQTITRAVTQALPGAQVRADLPNHRVTVTGTDDKPLVEGAIRGAGYTPTPA
ncbi:heavy-metal-associated domain-containing protein [Bordetella bronchialis]|uniref:Heavy metal transporter n=1 Tax=Bordetella bronchialis TaxID=463025 RepID=A0A193FXV1_9BORD|nr:heavy-metal-associated domain-containing protein [Bordetella bronchialis]ANN66762.1 heavy metal transporter [Bordetella bronchialis]ANN71839.1 heavy metal transporter [Bordetella bronchialis]